MHTIECRFAEFCKLTGDSVSAAILTLATLIESLAIKEEPAHNGMLTVPQTAKRLGVSVGTVRNLVTCGKLPASRIGKGRGTLRFDPALVAAYQRGSSGNLSTRPRVVR